MFILRRLTSENVERNTILGGNYLLVDRERNPEDFKKSYKAMGFVGDDEIVYGFISYNDGKGLEPLYKKSTYFIMVSNGQTFANITSR